ncbi:PREDICTED: cell cycle progression protein 1 isoform X2 [Chrysochloris asiatica]|uniref:Cell cycle progression protein 1 isoform X2 n=1 Tax=Chrysochloris asiatica TaxID=185453 RepID=A0A9B0SZ60_CHRAS|nr:PREDICTED: cell cycle progression protein 1 isoform X2 [Chrysochloris asiatica]
MSENSSDSDSSCGWTVINHEGSDIEMVNSEHGAASDSRELTPECVSVEQEKVQEFQLELGESSQTSTLVIGKTVYAAMEETKSVRAAEEEKSPEDTAYFGTVSDDSDIVTLEPPKLEEIGTQEEAVIVEEAQSPEDFNMGSSSSSQYTFCPPEIVFSSQPSDDESSSDEASHQPNPAFRRRRSRKKTVSSSESEERMPAEQETEPSKENLPKRQFSSGLNKCVILALVIAVSMGFGHFYGTIQVQKHQQLVRKIHEDELNDMKDYLSQCQQEQESSVDYKSLKENLARCWTLTKAEKMSFETQKKDLATENQYLRKLFVDFVNDVKDYLKAMKEYQVNNDGVFENLDGYIYRHFLGDTFSPPYGPSRPDKKQRMVNIENSRHRKQEQKPPQPQPNKREGKWHKYGRTNGRHMANLEIELGQLPFDPKY